MLIQSLREPEHGDIVHREAHAEIPPRVEYSRAGSTPRCRRG
ncbi:winged helix-turn-helix transcriptional regulator [Amycolatopsis sp. NPDC004368]